MITKMEQFPEKNPNPVLCADKDGIVLYANDAGKHLLREWRVQFGEKLPLVDSVQKAIFQNIPEKLEVKVGNSVYSVAFHYLPEEQCVNIYGFDITEQKELEEKLRKSEEKYRQIVTTAQEGIWMVEADGRISFVNEIIIDWLGFSVEELLGESVFQFFLEVDLESAYEHWKARKKGITESFDFRLKKKDGSYIWVIANITSRLDSQGNFVGNLVMFSNITERKLAESLREAINSINLIIYSSLDFDEIMQNALFEASKAFMCDTSAISLRKGNLWKVSYVDGFSEEIIGMEMDDEAEPHAVLAINAKRPVAIDDAFNDERVNQDHMKKWNIRSVLVVPLITRNEVIGVVFFNYHQSTFHFKDIHIDFATQLSSSLSLALENSRLFENLIIELNERKKAEEELKKAYDSLEDKVKERTSELEEAYKSLKESEERLAEAQKMAHIGSWDNDLVNSKIHWSEELYRIFERDPQEVMTYDKFLSYIHPDDKDYVYNSTQEAFKGKIYATTFRIVRPDGEERVVHSEREVIFDENKNPVRMKGTIQDITENKKAEEKLRESEEKYRNIVETANEGIALISSEGIITYVNKKMSDLLGYSIEEIVDRTIWDFVEEKQISTVTTRFENRKQGGTYDSFEFKLIRKDRTPLWVLISARAIFDRDGKFIGSLNMHTDITERKKTEEALRNFEVARKKELHHRIKNNLQVISSLLDLQADLFRGRKNITDSEVLKAFKESIDRVLSIALIHEELYKGKNIDLLNFSQYIQELAENLLLTYSLKIDVSLNFDLEENIFLDMDTAIPLGIAINEIVSNSFKYAFSSRDRGEIRIRLHREGNVESRSEKFATTAYVLSVSDNGIGIPESLKIEDLDSLGLQLVTSLVDQLDGELELSRNNGTEFTIKFTVTEKGNHKMTNPALKGNYSN